MGTRPAVEQLLQYVERFNHGVRSGDFTHMVAAFADDAEMVFEGIDAGPYRGRNAIAAAYRSHPPSDEVDVLEAVERADGTSVASYVWKSEPSSIAGELRITSAGGHIARLVVTFGTHSPDVTPG